MRASAVVDCVAVGAIGWIVRRSAREREAALDDQRATLERLRADLAGLVTDAERRARELETAVEARERRLRVLVAESGGVEACTPPPPRIDPAEARLLRDLDGSATQDFLGREHGREGVAPISRATVVPRLAKPARQTDTRP